MKNRNKGNGLLVKRISALKERERELQDELRVLLDEVVDSLNPAGILKSSVKDIITSPNLRTQLMNTAIGIGAGIAGKKLLIGKSDSIIKKLGGTAIEFMLGNFVRRRLPGLREKAKRENTRPQTAS